MMPIIIPALGVATLVAVNSDVTISDTKIVPETPLFCSAQAAEPECAVQVLAELRRPEARSTAQAGGRAAQRPPAPADIGGAVAVDGATAAVTSASGAAPREAGPPEVAAPADERTGSEQLLAQLLRSDGDASQLLRSDGGADDLGIAPVASRGPDEIAGRAAGSGRVTFGPTDRGFLLTIDMPGASGARLRRDGREVLLSFPRALPQVDASALQRRAEGLLAGVSVGFDTLLLHLAAGVTATRADSAGSLSLLLRRTSEATQAEIPEEQPFAATPGEGLGAVESGGPPSRAPGLRDEQGELRLRLLEAQLLAQTGQLAEARRRFEELRQAMPESAEPLNGLAGAAWRTGRWRQALGLYREALLIDPTDRWVADAAEAIERVHARRFRTDLEYREIRGGVDTGRATVVTGGIGGHQPFGDGWRLGFSFDLAYVDASQVRRTDGSIGSFSGLRHRAEMFVQHDGLDGKVFAGSLFVTGDTPGFGVRAELPDDRGVTTLRAEYRRPNWDFVQSLVGDGTRDRLAAGRRQQFTGDLTGRLDIGANRYGIEGDRDAASTFTVGGELRLGNLAGFRGLSTAYVFDGEYLLGRDERIGAGGQSFAPLHIVDREIHAATVGYSGARGTSAAEGVLTYEVSAGYGVDRYGKAGPLVSGVLGYALGSVEVRLRGGYVQNIGRARSTNTVIGASLTWIF
jgi:tetratricopeptide (TPR) repeat protein